LNAAENPDKFTCGCGAGDRGGVAQPAASKTATMIGLTVTRIFLPVIPAAGDDRRFGTTTSRRHPRPIQVGKARAPDLLALRVAMDELVP
jgi:hypothetical protein